MFGLWEKGGSCSLCWEKLLMVKKRISRYRKLIVALVVGVAIVAFWRGAWQLMDLFIFPENYLLSNIVSLLVGLLVLVLMHRAIKGLM